MQEWSHECPCGYKRPMNVYLMTVQGAMKLKRVKIHEYLVMQLDFSVAGQVKITMFDYIQEMLEDFHKFDPSKTISRTPAVDHLFMVRY